MFHLTRRPTRRLSSFLDLDKDIQSFFDTIPSWESVDRTTHLACDVKETKDKFILSFDTPGVEKDDIHIEVSKGNLTVSGERKFEEEKEEENFLRREVRYGSFSRSFSLPDGVNEEEIVADFSNGVLKVELPKAGAKEAKKISIR